MAAGVPRAQRSAGAVSAIRSRHLLAGLLLFACGVGIALVIENAPLRYVGSLTAIALAFGLLRRAFRVE